MYVSCENELWNDKVTKEWMKGIARKDTRPRSTGVSLVVPNSHFYLSTARNSLKQYGKAAKKSQGEGTDVRECSTCGMEIIDLVNPNTFTDAWTQVISFFFFHNSRTENQHSTELVLESHSTELVLEPEYWACTGITRLLSLYWNHKITELVLESPSTELVLESHSTKLVLESHSTKLVLESQDYWAFAGITIVLSLYWNHKITELVLESP